MHSHDMTVSGSEQGVFWVKGWHVCRATFATKDFFGATNFLTKNAPEFSQNFFEPLFCGSEKIPQNSRQIPHESSLPKIKKIHRRASAEAQGESFGKGI